MDEQPHECSYKPGYPSESQPGYPSPQHGEPGYPPQVLPQSTTTAVITSQPVVPIMVTFGNQPVAMTCPLCKAQIITTITYIEGNTMWLWVVLFCCFCGGLLSCWIPFFYDGFKDVRHSCPNCESYLGTYER